MAAPGAAAGRGGVDLRARQDYHKVLRVPACSPGRHYRPPRWGRSATASSPTRRRCWRWSWPPEAAWAGAASTRCCCRATRRLDVLPRRDSTSICRCPSARRVGAHCGSCSACIGVPHAGHSWRALPARCAALHLVPHHRARRPHSVELRALIGNRIYGCDDCQLACPWNNLRNAPHVARIRPVPA